MPEQEKPHDAVGDATEPGAVTTNTDDVTVVDDAPSDVTSDATKVGASDVTVVEAASESEPGAAADDDVPPGTFIRDGVRYQVVPRAGRRPRGEPPPAGPRSEELGPRVEARFRRAPRFSAFLAVGFIVGLVATVAWGLSVPPSGQASRPWAITVTGLFIVPATMLLAGAVALWVDWRSRRR